MQRYAIIDTMLGTVINVIEYEAAPSNPPPGFEDGIIAVQSDDAGPGWGWDGSALVAPAPPVVEVEQTVLSQDLMAQFTTDDAAKIQTAIAGNVSLWLLWQAMTAQRDPMQITNVRFQEGWSALVTVLGRSRMNEIATALSAPALLG